MREERYEPEDLPPLELRVMRELDLAEPTAEGREPHMCAASGVVRRSDFAYVIADDEVGLGVFQISGSEPGESRPVLPGELPADETDRKSQKPDLEALTALPPFTDTPYGGLLGLGSGSDSEGGRDRGFFWALAPDGSLHGEPRVIDLSPLYEMLRKELGDLNIEGAAVLGDELWLFHRGNEGNAGNVVAEIAFADLAGSLTGDLEIDVEELKALRRYELGEMDGVPLCFSDATALSSDLVCFTASAEGAEDGDIRGSVVGTISKTGEVHRLRTIDRKWKVEGVHAAVDTGVIDFVFVCDQDDADVASPLLTASMPLEAGIEPDSP